MKNKQFLIGAFCGISLLLIAATEYDLNKGVDLTGATSVTPTKLNQLVDNGTVAGNKGMLIYTNATPDTTNNTRYTRFMWMNTSYDPPRPYVYQTNTGTWTNITAVSSIADNSVVAGKLAASSVYGTNIANAQIDNTKMIAGTVNSNILGASSVYNFHIANNTIQSTNIAGGQILTTNIGNGEVTGSKIASGSIGTFQLTNGFALQGTNIASATITSDNIAQGGIIPTNLAASPTALYIPRVNGATTAFEWTTPGLLQSIVTNRADVVSCGTALELDDTIPQITEGDQVFTLTITPRSATSRLVITFIGVAGMDNNGGINTALFQDATANALAASTTYNANSSNPVNVGLRHIMTSGTTSATTFTLRIGCAAAQTAYLNATGAGTRVFGGVAASTFTIEEIY